MRVPIPRQLAQKISEQAVINARNTMQGWGWSDRALQSIQPMPSEGTVGIKTTLKYDQSRLPYLMYQERGIQPFLMHWVDGQTIPMACKQDGPHFRRGGHVGEPGYVDIPHVGQVWRAERWKHPGLQPKRFMWNALAQAIEDGQPMIKQWTQSLFGGG